MPRDLYEDTQTPRADFAPQIGRVQRGHHRPADTSRTGVGLLSISVAAELAGLHPQTLRIYEREGLLDPGRSAGGTRRYSARDMDRLQEICARPILIVPDGRASCREGPRAGQPGRGRPQPPRPR
jgi:hypothetical protein